MDEKRLVELIGLVLHQELETKMRSVIQEEFDHRMRTFEENMDQRMHALEEKMDVRMRAFEEKMDTRMRAFEQQTEYQLFAMQEQIDRISTMQEQVDRRVSTLQERVEHRLSAMEESLEGKMRDIVREELQPIVEKLDATYEHVGRLSEDMTRLHKRLDEHEVDIRLLKRVVALGE